MSVRQLGPADAAAYRDLRLKALIQNPSTFRAHHDEEVAQPLETFESRLAGNAIFGGYHNDSLCGLAGLEIPRSCNKHHKGRLFGVYVCPEQRGAGLGEALVQAVIDHARGQVEQLHVAVVTSAKTARRLYRRLGFVPYGIEPRALKVGQEHFDQELLVMLLDNA